MDNDNFIGLQEIVQSYYNHLKIIHLAADYVKYLDYVNKATHQYNFNSFCV